MAGKRVSYRDSFGEVPDADGGICASADDAGAVRRDHHRTRHAFVADQHADEAPACRRSRPAGLQSRNGPELAEMLSCPLGQVVCSGAEGQDGELARDVAWPSHRMWRAQTMRLAGEGPQKSGHLLIAGIVSAAGGPWRRIFRSARTPSSWTTPKSAPTRRCCGTWCCP